MDSEVTVQTGLLVDGRYRLERWLGDGTFSEVWRARDIAGDADATVVLKVFRPSARGGSPLGWPTVRREADAASRLGAPDRCLLPTGATSLTAQDGSVLPALVLPDVAGVTLADWLAADPVPSAANLAGRLAVLRDVLVALAGVHGAGAAHRDVGFGNVLVADRRAWLTDFGTCQIGDADPADADEAEPGLRPIQPPPYGGGLPVAQEQWRDLYSFAVVATMALTGHHPLTDDWRDLTPERWTGPPDPHRTLPRRDLVHDPLVAGLLAHCLSSARPTSAAEVLAAWP